jgi:predicted amidophosphoribosyltransferase
MQAIFAYKDERVSRLIWSIKYKRLPRALEIGGYALWRTLMKIVNETNSVGGSIIEKRNGDERKNIIKDKSENNYAGGGIIANISVNDGVCENVIKKIIIVPMPITDKRRRERGYNQCELLINEMRKISEENVTSGNMPTLITFENDLLLRTHHASHQKYKNREERLAVARGIFEVDASIARKISSASGATIVIIDDVITTGSTMREAMVALREAGFTNVRGLSLAH